MAVEDKNETKQNDLGPLDNIIALMKAGNMKAAQKAGAEYGGAKLGPIDKAIYHLQAGNMAKAKAVVRMHSKSSGDELEQFTQQGNENSGKVSNFSFMTKTPEVNKTPLKEIDNLPRVESPAK